MYKVTYKYGSVNRNESWKLGKEKPSISSESVVSLTVSDTELTHIHQYFRNIPSVSMKTEVTWHGDIAKFIYENL